MTYADIAEKLQCSDSTARRRVREFNRLHKSAPIRPVSIQGNKPIFRDTDAERLAALHKKLIAKRFASLGGAR